MMKQKLFLLFLAIVACVATTWAVPAKPGWYTHTQSDGKTVTVELVGDEFSSATLTRDGLMVYRAEDGDYYYLSSLTGRTTMRAHDEKFRSGIETTFIEAQKSQLKFKYDRSKSSLTAPNRVGGSNAEAGIPAFGKRRIPVLLVQFDDIQFKCSTDEINNYVNKVKKYFLDQSNEKYTADFEVFGIYDVPGDRKDYGSDNGENKDVNVFQLYKNAIQLAQADGINFNDYDTDGDGICDIVIFIYAGVGQNDVGAPEEAIWPKHSTFSHNYVWGGCTFNRVACFNELKGINDEPESPQVDGIGVMCHEFSHALGLPDFYDTEYIKADDGTYIDREYGMGYWSLMCNGCYNKNDTPIGYNAYEKQFMGWAKYTKAEPGTYYTLPVWNQGSEDTDVAIRIESDVCENEYFIYEYRKKQGWDAEIQDEGIMVTHVSYVEDRWSDNKVNAEKIQLMTILPYDGITSTSTETKDLWGIRPNSSITSTTLYLNSDGTVNASGNAGTFNMGVTEMNIEQGHNFAHFWYKQDAARILEVNPKKIDFGNVPCGTSSSVPVTVRGRNIEGNINISIVQTPAHWPQEFSANENSLVCTPEGITFNVTYKPPQFATPDESHHSGFLRIQTDYDVISIPLSGTCYIYNDEDGDGLFSIDDISSGIDKVLTTDDLTIDDISLMIDALLNGETTVNLESSLVAHYPLDGNTNDMSGNGNDGIGNNITYTKGVTGDDNGACRFGGIDSPGYIRIPNSESLKFTDGFTFSCYFKPMNWKGKNASSTSVEYGSHCIFAKSNNTTGPTLMFKGSSDGMRVWSEATSTQNQWANIDSEDLLPNDNYLNKWVHVAISYSKSKKTARLYINGNLVKQKYVKTDFDYSQMNSKDLYLGQFLGTSWMNPMCGALDEVRIYNRYLGAGEIYNLSVRFKKDLRVALSPNEVFMNVGDVVKVDIINGGGNYSVGCAPAVVDCHLAGESIILTGMGEGTTNVTFIDLESDTYILLPVTVSKATKNYTVNGVTFTMIPVQGGTFTMGATAEQGSDANANEKPAHEVTLSNYMIGQTEVTQALWVAVMGNNPSYFTGNLQCPVEQVSWDDCQTFISRLNALTGESFRLPTEAEWEYAARGDGVSNHYKYAGGNKLSEVAWWGCGYDEDSPLGNSAYTTHMVGLKTPNELGLYDMSGNVFEWCQDWYGAYSSASQTNPTGPASGTNRVTRGGGWGYGDVNCRVSYRMSSSPSYRHPCQGLRLAL